MKFLTRSLANEGRAKNSVAIANITRDPIRVVVFMVHRLPAAGTSLLTGHLQQTMHHFSTQDRPRPPLLCSKSAVGAGLRESAGFRGRIPCDSVLFPTA